MQVGISAKLCDDSEFAYGFPRFYPLRPLWSKLIKKPYEIVGIDPERISDTKFSIVSSFVLVEYENNLDLEILRICL